MKTKLIIIPALATLVLALVGCETTINPTLQSAQASYIVDAFVTNKPDTQVIRLSLSQPYFEDLLPPPVTGAVVTVSDEGGVVYDFAENPNVKGDYIWVPNAIDTAFGVVGHTYTLSVKANGESFVSTSKMGRVPPIDSITFKADNRAGETGEFYTGQFWARDPLGAGDTYWIKSYKNGVLLNKPSEINLAYDAAFSKGSNFDGLTFIQPIRNGISPEETDANNKRISPFIPGDSVYVEIHSLTEASFDFLNEVVIQTNRPGGFGELFAKPLANVSTNITNENPQRTRVQGFFNVGSLSSRGQRFIQ